MIIINNYHEYKATEESNEEWIEKYYPAMNDSSHSVVVQKPGNKEIEELREEISKLTDIVSELARIVQNYCTD